MEATGTNDVLTLSPEGGCATVGDVTNARRDTLSVVAGAAIVVMALSVGACGGEGESAPGTSDTGTVTFNMRSEIDPSSPLAVEVGAIVPAAWPAVDANVYGEPRFRFGGGYYVSVTVTQESVEGNAPARRIDEVVADQLFPDSVQRQDMPGARRWMRTRTRDDVRGWFYLPGPEDGVVICAFFLPATREPEGRSFCESVEVR